jgi:hypothetical protein
MSMLKRLVAVFSVLALLTQGAWAQTVSSADQNAIHTAIQAQIDAIARNDYDAAYALAAPGIKVLYTTTQTFAAMIKGRYPPLIKPKSIVFGGVTQTPQGPVQKVFITGADGKPYVASYSLQQQPDNSWLIAGCTLTRDRDSSAI